MSRIRFVAVALATAVTTAGAMILAGSGAFASELSDPAPVSAHVWVTTPDGADKLTDLGTVAFGDAPMTAPTIVVDPSRTFQTMHGFGGAITDSSATVLYRLSAAARAATMRSLFDPVTGDGLDYLRQPIGASDFIVTAAYTYDDMPAGQTDYSLAHFSASPTIRRRSCRCCAQAKPLNPRLQIMATPWSPPAWMKTGGSLIGGRLIDDPRIYRAYATVPAQVRPGVPGQRRPVDAITVQNEPQNRTPAGYPGTDMPSWQEEKVIEDLGPMLRAAGLQHQDPRLRPQLDRAPERHRRRRRRTRPPTSTTTRRRSSSSPAARWVSGTAYHCYFGDPSAMTALHNEFPSTRRSTSPSAPAASPADPANTFSDTLKWHARNLIIGATRNWAKTVVNWNIALDSTGGPHVGGCGTCTGSADGRSRRHGDTQRRVLHARSPRPLRGAGRGPHRQHLLRHDRLERRRSWTWRSATRTAARCWSRTTRTTTRRPSPYARATRPSPTPCPAGALATFVWHGASTGADGLRPIDPAGWTASGEPAGPTDPCCSGDVAANAVDDDASTRYCTGTGQAPGQYLQVDFGQRRPVRQIVFDTGASTGDFPRGYRVTTSADGVHWSTAVAERRG